MTILFMGGEMAALTPSDSTVVENASSAFYNSSFARAGVQASGSTAYVEGTPSASATTAWLHFDISIGGAQGTNATRLSWYDSSGNERVRLGYAGSTNVLTLSYWNGSAFVSAGTASIDMDSTLQTIDINVVCNSASGSLVLYIAGTERINSGTVSTTSITNLKKWRGFAAVVSGVNSHSYFSQFIMADEPTIGWRLITRYPNAAGSTSSWGGAYTDIDETVYSDADFIYSATANQVSTFGQTGPTISGYVVRAVAVSARAKKGASGPTQIQLALRSAGTDYFSSTQALTVGYTPVQNIWETDPATTASWLASAITTLQPGVKSIA